jgi:hypothetical protein
MAATPRRTAGGCFFAGAFEREEDGLERVLVERD